LLFALPTIRSAALPAGRQVKERFKEDLRNCKFSPPDGGSKTVSKGGEDMDIKLTDQNFEEEVIKSDIPVLVDFWAEWCMPCKIVGPVVEELAKEYAGKLKVGKLNVDENQIASQFGIMSIPSIYFFKQGKVVKTMIGAQPKDSFKSAIDEVLNS